MNTCRAGVDSSSDSYSRPAPARPPLLPQGLITANVASALSVDELGNTPLHALCNQRSVTFDLVEKYLCLAPGAAHVANNRGRTVLHHIAGNDALGGSRCATIIAAIAAAYPGSALALDDIGATPLHNLCANMGVTPASLSALISFAPAAVDVVSQWGRTPLRTLCENPSLSTSLLADFVATAPGAFKSWVGVASSASR